MLLHAVPLPASPFARRLRGACALVAWVAGGLSACAATACGAQRAELGAAHVAPEAASAGASASSSLAASTADPERGSTPDLEPASDGAPAHPAAAREPALHPELFAHCDDERRIVVFKAARILELRCGELVVRRFETSLGFAPEGAKAVEGDGRTPEGDYFVSRKFASRFHRSLQLAYPNAEDAAEGLRRGVIRRAEYDAIVGALASCREPPQNTGLGSLIQIHGNGGGRDVGDWTLGCVAVDNPEIEEVFAFHRPGCDRDGRPLTRVTLAP